MAQRNQETGAQGERIAAQFLKRSGYAVIETNWHCRYGEIDIIALQTDIWVFVEVKTRYERAAENAFASITGMKQQRFVKAVQQYLAQHNLDEAAWRIDAIAVVLSSGGITTIKHVEDAFDW